MTKVVTKRLFCRHELLGPRSFTVASAHDIGTQWRHRTIRSDLGDRYDKIRVRLIDRNPGFEAKKTAHFLILLERRRYVDEFGLIGKKDRLIKRGVIERGAEIAFRLDLGE